MSRAAEGVVACTLREAQRRLGGPAAGDPSAAPAVARRLRAAGARAVCLVGVDTLDGRALDWLDSEHACGWLASAPAARRGGEADAQAFARALAAALARGFVAADAAVIAAMALAAGGPPGDSAGARQVLEAAGAGWPEAPEALPEPALLPQLSWGEAPLFAAPAGAAAGAQRRLDLYAVVDSADRVRQVLDAGLRTVQLRIKTPAAPDAAWHAQLRSELRRSVADCAAAAAELFVNDHWQLAGELGARGVHLGQEDLLALGEAGRDELRRRGLAIGISSHSLWELCRARTLAPRYIACGPVWPTLTKAMPWRAQGLDNLAWWCRMAGAPVVAIGGVLEAEKVREAARCGADGVCIVRGLGEDPRAVVPALQAALDAGRSGAVPPHPAPAWPHPSLSSD